MALSKKTRNILLAIGSLALLGTIAAVLVYIFVYNKPHRNYESATIDYSLTSDELYDAFATDEKAAFAKYQDQVVQVTGPVESVNKVQDGMIQVVLIAENAMLGGVKAQLHAKYRDNADYKPAVEKIQKASEATLKCRCVGMDAEVVLDNCFVIAP